MIMQFIKNNIKNWKFCINLSDRLDKKRKCEKEFKKAKIKVSFIKWVKHKVSYFWCTLSHIKILKQALKKKLGFVIIFEDDVHINNPQTFKKDLECAIKNLPDDWHILYLGWLIGRNGKIKKVNKYIYSVNHFMCTYWVIYNEKSYLNLIKNFPENDKNITENEIIRDGYGSIDSWLAFIYQKKFPCYVTSRLLVSERKEFSDIKKKVRNTKIWYTIRFFIFKYKIGFLLNYLWNLANLLKIKHEFLKEK